MSLLCPSPFWVVAEQKDNEGTISLAILYPAKLNLHLDLFLDIAFFVLKWEFKICSAIVFLYQMLFFHDAI